MIVSAHQPPLLPWVGFWAKARASDVMVLMAGVKFKPEDYINRAKIGSSLVGIPVLNRHSTLPVHAAQLDRRALPRLARTLRNTYGSKKHVGAHRIQYLADVIEAYPGDSLLDLNVMLLEHVKSMLGLQCKFVVDTTERTGGTTSSRLADLLAPHKPDVYLSGTGGHNYLKASDFPATEVVFQDVTGIPDESIVLWLATSSDPLQSIAKYPKAL